MAMHSVVPVMYCLVNEAMEYVQFAERIVVKRWTTSSRDAFTTRVSMNLRITLLSWTKS